MDLMKTLLKQLIKIDELTGDFYGQAINEKQKNYDTNALFAGLQRSRLKSKWILLSAIKELPATMPALLDPARVEELKEECCAVFNKITVLAGHCSPNAKELLEVTLEIELTRPGKLYSEAIDALRRNSRTFITLAATTQWRRRLLQSYIKHRYEYTSHLELFEKLPRVWTENLLIADDSIATTTLLADTLSCEGSVHTAGNGISALRKLEKKYFAAIISDVSMPLMGGVDFDRSAERKYPGIRRRFIFFTDTASMNDIDFFKINKINYLPKPSSLKNIREAVLKVMGGTI